MNELPPGFVLDESPGQDNTGLPPGFVLDEPSVTTDVLKSAGTGVVRGAAAIAGLPGDIQRGMEWVGDRVGDLIFGADTPEQAAAVAKIKEAGRVPTTGEIRQAGTDLTGITLHEPETRAGRYAETIGEFIPGSMAGPGGVLSKITRFALLPGAASEAAGEATEGTPIEPFARAGAALATGGVAAVTSRPSTPARALREVMPSNMTQADVQAAGRLIAEAGQRGVGLTWPEALAQVTGRRVDLTDVQRVVEQTTGGRPVMSEFMARRPEQVRNAADAEFNAMAPVADPVRTGIRIRDVSEEALTGLRQRINRATEPLYQRGGQSMVPDPVFANIARDPLFQQTVQAIRNDPVYARSIAGFPDRSVQVFNEVKKVLDDLASSSSTSGRNYAASVYGGLARDVRTAAQNASPDYAQALSRQAQYRQNVLEPAQTGPLGRMSETADVRQQTAALLPENPLAGSEHVVAQTVRRLVRNDPQAATQLVRSHLATAFDEAAQANIGGANAAGGAKFTAKIIGNRQQEMNLQAAIMALPNGPRLWAALRQLMEVFEATGKRAPPNSATEFNRRLTNRMESGSMAGTGASVSAAPVSALTVVNDWYKQFRLGRNSEALARIITDPGNDVLIEGLLNARTLTDRQRAAAALLLEGQTAARTE